MEQSIDAWSAAGNSEIASQMRNAHEFERELLATLADSKRSIWKDLQMAKNQSATDDEKRAEFAKMRSKLLTAHAEADEKVGKVDAYLREKLSKLGIHGEKQAEHLANFLAALSFQLAA